MPSIEAIRARADPALRNRFRACLLAGAAGDALGAAVEFSSKQAIHAQFGPGGIRDYAPAYGRLGAITDDTQMTLFTAEGLMRAWVRWSQRGLSSMTGVVGHAYQRWLRTQGIAHPKFKDDFDGWLIGIRELHAQRAPGRTCISALLAMESFGDFAKNQSKGCGGVMRVAPVGLFEASAMQPGARGSSGNTAFDLGCETAAITPRPPHRHPRFRPVRRHHFATDAGHIAARCHRTRQGHPAHASQPRRNRRHRAPRLRTGRPIA